MGIPTHQTAPIGHPISSSRTNQPPRFFQVANEDANLPSSSEETFAKGGVPTRPGSLSQYFTNLKQMEIPDYDHDDNIHIQNVLDESPSLFRKPTEPTVNENQEIDLEGDEAFVEVDDTKELKDEEEITVKIVETAKDKVENK